MVERKIKKTDNASPHGVETGPLKKAGKKARFVKPLERQAKSKEEMVYEVEGDESKIIASGKGLYATQELPILATVAGKPWDGKFEDDPFTAKQVVPTTDTEKALIVKAYIRRGWLVDEAAWKKIAAKLRAHRTAMARATTSDGKA